MISCEDLIGSCDFAHTCRRYTDSLFFCMSLFRLVGFAYRPAEFVNCVFERNGELYRV